MAPQRGLEPAALDQWSVLPDGKLADADKKKFHDVRDAFRAFAFAATGRIPRDDIYYLAILRRKLAERDLPVRDGPIAVVALGDVFPEPLFYSTKKLFPVRTDARTTVFGSIGDAVSG